ncbi:MAG: alpha/beta hydrolase [Planctomycetes bacterium]|nr:alpha/beta hydrolase [Planctomycetota bacterium]
MPFMPFNVLGIWFRGLLALALLGGGVYLLTQWYHHREILVTESLPASEDREPVEGGASPAGAEERPTGGEKVRTRVVSWQFGLNRETAFLLGGLALLGWSLGGGWVVSPRLWRRAEPDQPKAETPGDTQRLRLPDGTTLRVESCGPPDGDPVVLTHGWGLDSHEWYYARKELAGRFRVITWDLPGLGASDRPADRDWALEKLARDLDAVLALAGGRPVVLVGHSIGVMITLTYCRLFPEALGNRVRGLVLAHGTYTNPVRTTAKAGLYSALQKPVLEPLCHLMVWLSPLVRVLNWLSYLNGSAHRSTERSSFSGNETRGQLDFLTRYYCQAAPDVLGRGMLAMFRYEATEVLGRIRVPTLVVGGERDNTCRPEASRYMAEAIPGARLRNLGGAKHCGLFEFHGEFHTAVTEFLASEGAFSRPVPRGPEGARPMGPATS